MQNGIEKVDTVEEYPIDKFVLDRFNPTWKNPVIARYKEDGGYSSHHYPAISMEDGEELLIMDFNYSDTHKEKVGDVVIKKKLSRGGQVFVLKLVDLPNLYVTNGIVNKEKIYEFFPSGQIEEDLGVEDGEIDSVFDKNDESLSEAYFEFHKQFCNNMIEVTRAKNADYTGKSNNPFANFEAVENIEIVSTEKGFLTRMMDKMMRINSFVDKGILEVSDESVEDTLHDLANYCALMAGYIKHKKGEL